MAFRVAGFLTAGFFATTFFATGFFTAGFFVVTFLRGTLTGPLFDGGRSPLESHSGRSGNFFTFSKMVAS